MKAKVYRSVNHEGRFLYVREDISLNDLPSEMFQSLGKLREIITIDLDKVTKLVQVNVEHLKKVLSDVGYLLFIRDPEIIEKEISASINKF